jgi:hypothetical protein
MVGHPEVGHPEVTLCAPHHASPGLRNFRVTFRIGGHSLAIAKLIAYTANVPGRQRITRAQWLGATRVPLDASCQRVGKTNSHPNLGASSIIFCISL